MTSCYLDLVPSIRDQTCICFVRLNPRPRPSHTGRAVPPHGDLEWRWPRGRTINKWHGHHTYGPACPGVPTAPHTTDPKLQPPPPPPTDYWGWVTAEPGLPTTARAQVKPGPNDVVSQWI